MWLRAAKLPPKAAAPERGWSYAYRVAFAAALGVSGGLSGNGYVRDLGRRKVSGISSGRAIPVERDRIGGGGAQGKPTTACFWLVKRRACAFVAASGGVAASRDQKARPQTRDISFALLVSSRTTYRSQRMQKHTRAYVDLDSYYMRFLSARCRRTSRGLFTKTKLLYWSSRPVAGAVEKAKKIDDYSPLEPSNLVGDGTFVDELSPVTPLVRSALLRQRFYLGPRF